MVLNRYIVVLEHLFNVSWLTTEECERGVLESRIFDFIFKSAKTSFNSEWSDRFSAPLQSTTFKSNNCVLGKWKIK